MVNFKEETLQAIKESGHTEEDVMFVGSRDGKYRMNIGKFLKKSDFIYDDGYGSPQIAQDLIVYFKDKSYMTRGEYDGSEWWEYNKLLDYSETDDYETFEKLGVHCEQIGWEDVKSINEYVSEEEEWG